MKIPLHIRQRFGQKLVFALISIRAPQYHIRPMITQCLVDTGSPWTAITPHDTFLLKIPVHALEKDTNYPTIMFASHKFWRLLMKGVDIHIKDETGKIVTINMPSISILEPTKKVSFEEFKGIPSVLGCDFLSINKCSLYFDPNKDVAFFEKKE